MKNMQNIKRTKILSAFTALLVASTILPAAPVNAAAPRINKSSASLYVGQKTTLKIKDVKNVSWKSSNSKIASVNRKGVVTARKAGRVTIKGSASRKTYTCKLTVKNCKLSSTKSTVELGKSKQIKLTGAAAGKVKWSSSNTKVATVKSGRVKSVAVGSAVIKAKYLGKTYSHKVTVKHTKCTFVNSEKNTRINGDADVCMEYQRIATCKYCKARKILQTKEIKHQPVKAVEKSPVCGEENGYITYKCADADCLYTSTEIIPAPQHEFAEISTTESTCTNDGYITSRCKNCGKEKAEVIEKTGHNYQTTITNPTCTKYGKEIKICSKCGDRITTKLEPVGHLYSEYTIVSEPTCTEDGLETRVCNICDEEQERIIEATGHNFKTSTCPALCTEDGYSLTTCTKCDYSNKTIIPGPGHTYEEDKESYIAPTCKSTGVSVYICSVCGERVSKALPIIAHNYVEDLELKQPTCENFGVRQLKCSMCGETKSEVIPKLSHDYKLESVTNPTCTDDGARISKCTKCGSEKREIIDALTHNYVTLESKEATCTESGFIKSECSRCKDARINYISALNHDLHQTEIKEATCKQEGAVVTQCSRCGAEFSQPIPKKSHMLSDTSVAPTCEEPGKTIHRCENCDYEETTLSGEPALGHNYEVIGTEEANCVHGTGTIKKCAACNKSITEYDANKTDTHASYSFEAVDNNLFQLKCDDCGIVNKNHPDVYNHKYPSMGQTYQVNVSDTDIMNNTYVEILESEIETNTSTGFIQMNSKSGNKSVKINFILVKNEVYVDGCAVKIMVDAGDGNPYSLSVIDGESVSGDRIYLPKLTANGKVQKAWFVNLAFLKDSNMGTVFVTDPIDNVVIQYTNLYIRQ